MTLTLILALVSLLIFGVWVAPVSRRYPARMVGLLLLMLALFPNSSTITDERIAGEGFRLFTRYFGGVLSPWDLLLLILIVLMGVALKRNNRLLKPLVGLNPSLRAFILVWFFGVVVGLVNSTLIPYGPSSLRSMVQQALPAFYLLASYVLVRASLSSSKDIDLIIRTFYLCNGVLLLQGVILFTMARAGLYPAIKGFLGIPIVLYDQLTFLTIGVSLAFAKYLFVRRLGFLDWIVMIGGLFFLIASTRRLVWLTTAFDFILIWFLSGGKHLLSKMRVRGIALVLFVTVCVVGITLSVIPQIGDAAALIVQSFNFGSDVGKLYAGDLRLGEINNMFQNMDTQSPFSYIWGMGTGTYYYEFVYLGLPTDVGTTAYIQSLLETGRMGWWPYFHLPYLSAIYRFGLGGIVLLLLAGWRWFLRWIRLINGWSPAYRYLGLVIVVLGIQALLAIGDSVDSAHPALMGITFGILEALALQQWQAKQTQSKQAENGM